MNDHKPAYRHVKSFSQFVAEDYNAVLRSDSEIKIHTGPDFEEAEDRDSGEDIEENIEN